MQPGMIVVRDLTKIYHLGDVEVPALRGVAFEIRQGEFVAIMGPSGSGKSTLMHILGCLDIPTSGSYMLDGVEVARLSDESLSMIRALKLGFVFQRYHLLTRQTALRNVEMPLIYRGVPAAVRERRARAALQIVGMGDRIQHLPNQLSGGQQQRVAIARALVGSPKVILADEPTGALDTRTSVEIMGIFQRLNQAQGLTVIVVTHNPEVAEYAGRVLQMRDGLLTSDEPSSQGTLVDEPSDHDRPLTTAGARMQERHG
jgi:putative ABC transport system ATP-binding protein